MRKLLCFIAAIYINTVSGQNLVLNPSLDVFITCPGFGQFSNAYISNWNKPTIASSDYYNYNCAGIQPTVQAPYSGEGYAGIIAYNFGTEYREYITGTFSSPLTAGKTYNVEFYASLNDGYIQAVEELGAYISVAAPGPFSNVLHINVIPQIENTIVALDDTVQWMKVSGQFVALGGEQYITIGNFHNDATTTITQPGNVGSFGAYYFIDAVSVELDSTTSVQDFNSEPEMSIWMSQTEIQIKIVNVSVNEFPFQLTIHNSMGQKVFEHVLNSGNETIRLNSKANQVYFFTLNSSSGINLGAKAIMLE